MLASKDLRMSLLCSTLLLQNLVGWSVALPSRMSSSRKSTCEKTTKCASCNMNHKLPNLYSCIYHQLFENEDVVEVLLKTVFLPDWCLGLPMSLLVLGLLALGCTTAWFCKNVVIIYKLQNSLGAS